MPEKTKNAIFEITNEKAIEVLRNLECVLKNHPPEEMSSGVSNHVEKAMWAFLDLVTAGDVKGCKGEMKLLDEKETEQELKLRGVIPTDNGDIGKVTH